MSLVVGVLLTTLVALTATSWLAASHRADDIVQARAPQWARPGEEIVAAVLPTGIIVDGLSQFPIVYVEPLTDRAPEGLPAPPPGLNRWPEPGEAVISPGVRRQGMTASSFGFTTSGAGSGADGDIGDEGLVSRSEGLIYARPTQPLRWDGPEAVAFGVAGFGGDNGAFIETEPDVPPLSNAVGYSVWMVLLPCLFLAVSSSRAVSELIEQRAATLWRLGVARRRVRLVILLETMVLAGVGALGGVAGWLLLARGRTTLPLSDAHLVPGSLRMPWGVVLGVVSAVLLTALVAAASTPAGARPRREPGRRATVVAAAAQTLGWGVMLASGVLGQTRGSDGILLVLAVGFALTVFSFPLAVAAATRLLARLPRPQHPPFWMAWQRLRRTPRAMSRPAAQAGLLVLVSASALVLAKGLPTKILHSPWDHEQRSVSLLTWDEGMRFELETPSDAEVVVAPVVRGGGGVVLDDCEQALIFTGMTGQADCAPGDLPPQVLDRLDQWEIPAVTAPAASNGAWVSTPVSWSQADVLKLAAGAPAPTVEQKIGPLPFTRTAVDWILATWLLGSVVLAATLVRSLGDHLVRALHDGSVLDRIGLRHRDADAVLASTTLLPLLPALALAAVGTWLFAVKGEGVGYTVASVSIVAGAVLLGAILLVVMVHGALWLRRGHGRG